MSLSTRCFIKKTPLCFFIIYSNDEQFAWNFTKTTAICVKFFPDVACQKLLKSANVSRTYSKNKSATFFMDHGVCFELAADSRKVPRPADKCLGHPLHSHAYRVVSYRRVHAWFGITDAQPRESTAVWNLLNSLLECIPRACLPLQQRLLCILHQLINRSMTSVRN